MAKTKSYENPLIPHQRMRALYRGLLETRALIGPLPKAQRLPRGQEACWVATAIALEPGDLTSDSRTLALPAYLRSLGQRPTAGSPRPREIGIFQAASVKPFAGTPFERLLCAAGAAMALKAAAEQRVAIAYVRGDELTPPEWKRLIQLAAPGDLPLIIVAIGAAPHSSAAIPIIPVDASDSIALYRVAQESILRARADGGLVVLDCVPSAVDPLTLLASQLLAKGAATNAWLQTAETQTRHAFAESAGGVH